MKKSTLCRKRILYNNDSHFETIKGNNIHVDIMIGLTLKIGSVFYIHRYLDHKARWIGWMNNYNIVMAL
jgi:hypothetical protein